MIPSPQSLLLVLCTCIAHKTQSCSHPKSHKHKYKASLMPSCACASYDCQAETAKHQPIKLLLRLGGRLLKSKLVDDLHSTAELKYAAEFRWIGCFFFFFMHSGCITRRFCSSRGEKGHTHHTFVGRFLNWNRPFV